MLVAGLVLTGYALIQPQQSAKTYTLSIQQVNKNEPGVRSSSVKYGDLSDKARIAFSRAKLHGSYKLSGDPPAELQQKSFVIDHDTVYSLTISQHDHITERMATVPIFGSKQQSS